MNSDIFFVCCAFVALFVGYGLCAPASGNINEKLSDNSLSMTVIPMDPIKIIKVEVVSENGETTFEEVEIIDNTRTTTSTTAKPSSTTEETEDFVPRERIKLESSKKRDEESHKYKCSWRRLYRLYLKKRRSQNRKKVYSDENRREIRQAFKIVCENPEDVIKLLLDMD